MLLVLKDTPSVKQLPFVLSLTGCVMGIMIVETIVTRTCWPVLKISVLPTVSDVLTTDAFRQPGIVMVTMTVRMEVMNLRQ